jgi:hypothetical protein
MHVPNKQLIDLAPSTIRPCLVNLDLIKLNTQLCRPRAIKQDSTNSCILTRNIASTTKREAAISHIINSPALANLKAAVQQTFHLARLEIVEVLNIIILEGSI